MGIFMSIAKRRKLTKLSLVLSNPAMDIASLMDGSKDRALEELIALCEHDTETSRVITSYGVNRDDLIEIYRALVVGGAGMWAGRHWVAVSSLAYPDSLDYALRNLTGKEPTKENYLEVALNLVEHFGSGTRLPLPGSTKPRERSAALASGEPIKQSTSPEPNENPSIGFVSFPIGIGIAYGIFGRGFVTSWPAEAFAISLLWGIGPFVLRSSKYRIYVVECENMNQRPNPPIFIALQTMQTGAVILMAVGLTAGIRWLVSSL
jgi:hypothetical protein